MRYLLSLSLIAVLASLAQAEIVDRLAVAVSEEIITEQQILLHLRVAAFLNGEEIKTGEPQMRATAQKLIELTMIRIEMEINRYPAPDQQSVDNALALAKKQRFGDSDASYRAALTKYQVTEDDVKESLKAQLAILSFIEFRFRPGVQIGEEELLEYYRDSYADKPAPQGPNPGPPAFNDIRGAILEQLTQERIDNLLDRWLNQTESQTRIRWVDDVFRSPRP